MINPTGKSKALEVFVDVDAHRLTADIIKRHSTNRNDVRELALHGLDLSGCRRILDLGCGFGFFTAALKGRVHPDAVVTGVDIIGEYEPLFLDTCKEAGLGGEFRSSGISAVRDLEDASIDLILCSYSLYFFPESIGDLARLLKGVGRLVAITHHKEGLREAIRIARNFLGERGLLEEGKRLPIEELLSEFSSENGYEILSRWFQDVRALNYENALVFGCEELSPLLEYFRFKWPFFHTRPRVAVPELIGAFRAHLEAILYGSPDGLVISKDDQVFVCSNPLYGKKP
jgi:SAM-dependent methyltransferase